MAYNYYNNTNPYLYQTPSSQQPLQIQNGGFISVRSEQDARNYPVAPGNSVTFKDETAPYVYTKTMGFYQLDRPIFEKYKLIKEEVPDETLVSTDTNISKKIEEEIARLWTEINSLKENKRSQQKKEMVKND